MKTIYTYTYQGSVPIKSGTRHGIEYQYIWNDLYDTKQKDMGTWNFRMNLNFFSNEKGEEFVRYWFQVEDHAHAHIYLSRFSRFIDVLDREYARESWVQTSQRSDESGAVISREHVHELVSSGAG
jgi:hypothetical protein